MADCWFMSEEGDDDMGWVWDIKELVDGKLIHICSVTTEDRCRHILAALRWVDELGEFKMGLKADAFIFPAKGYPRAKKKAPGSGAKIK